jgi:hypothetical protein
MAPKMSSYASSARAKEAFELRARRLSWREICDRLGYRSIGAAQTAVNRYTARERREPTTTSVETHKFGIETRTRALNVRFAAAFQAADDDTLISLNREIIRNEAELARIGGFYMPERIDVTVTQQTLPELVAAARERALEIVDAEVVEQKEITR